MEYADELNDPKLKAAAEAVENLPRPEPRAGLTARTLQRISAGYKPVKKVYFLLRPITHPLARIAAAAVIIYALAPMTDIDFGSKAGSFVEQHILGPSVSDRIDNFVNGMLSKHEWMSADSQPYLDAFMGVSRPASTNTKHASTAHTRLQRTGT